MVGNMCTQFRCREAMPFAQTFPFRDIFAKETSSCTLPCVNIGENGRESPSMSVGGLGTGARSLAIIRVYKGSELVLERSV